MLQLQQNREQRQTIAPVLIQSLRCLQLPWVELRRELQRLWETNPCIDLVAPEEDGRWVEGGGTSASEKERWEEKLVHHESLEDYLVHQVPELRAEEKEIFSFLISHLDERGYLRETVGMLLPQCPWSAGELKSVLGILRSLEPKGIGAQDLIDCWSMQIPEKQEVIRQFLALNREDLLAKRYHRVLKRMRWSRQQLAQVLNYLRGLTVAPLSHWQEPESPVCIPDLYFSREVEGQWCIRLASESYALRWSDVYKDWLCQSKARKSAGMDGYFLSQGQMAKQWMRALSSREALLQRIGQFILDKQRLFFEKKDHPLMPLLQKLAAGELGINPATLSRALQGKYASVPWGILPLGDFFPRAWEEDRVKVAIPQIRQKICEWVAEEDKDHPLSDEALSRRLREEMHWNIPRRTVENYRRQWGIASSRDRKYGLSSC